MKKLNLLEFLTGFLMGAFAAAVLEGCLVIFFNLLARWSGWAPFQPAWWMFLPLPLLSGLMMGRAIASLHLEDY